MSVTGICDILVLFCLQVSIVLCFDLTVLHTNDIHGRFEETDKHGFVCNTKDDACFGGVARIATAVKDVRNKAQNVVFVDGADRFTGTIWSEVYKGNASRVFFNQLNYTAIVSINTYYLYCYLVTTYIVPTLLYGLGAPLRVTYDPLHNILHTKFQLNISRRKCYGTFMKARHQEVR